MSIKTFICPVCKKSFEKNDTFMVGDNSYCSVGCYQSVHRRKSKKRIDIRNLVFERDNYTCQKCKVRGIKLDVHHKDKSQKDGDWESANNNLDNLISLCYRCHQSEHLGRNIIRDRIDFIKECRKNGETLQTIGDRFGVSKERIRQILL